MITAQDILARFTQQGAQAVDLPILQPADTLLDLYGEDIRARAYTTRDPVLGEMMLRPDFTVPVVQMHLSRDVPQARYAYAGQVFRMQDSTSTRPIEHMQSGFEIFGGDAAETDAEIFATIADLLAGLRLRGAMGDIGILRAAVEGLSTSRARKSALLRHIWRPKRFRKLLDRFANPRPARDIPAIEAPMIGKRGADEIELRKAVLTGDATEPPIPAEQVALVDAILTLRDKAPAALINLSQLAQRHKTIGPAVSGFAARLDALGRRGVDVESLDFEGSYGRTSMEYYDGFVFGFYAETHPAPPVATGGRYDALTRAMGGNCAAVGGVIRPALLPSGGTA